MGKSVEVLGNVNGDVGSRSMLELFKRKLFKIIFWLFLLVAFPFTVLLLIGSQRFVYQAEISISAPVEAIFPFLHQPSKIPLWQNGVQELKPIENDFNRPDHRAHLILALDENDGKNGNNHSIPIVIKDIFPSTRLITDSETSIFKSQTIWELKKLDDHSVVRQEVVCFYSGVGRFLAPFMTSEAERQLQEDLWKLREVVEQQQGDSWSP